MWKLYLRLYLLLFGGLLGALLLLNAAIVHIALPESDAHTRQLVRGQLYHLVQDLSAYPPAARATRLAQLQPHYGLQLKLSGWQALRLSPAERIRLERGDYVARDDNAVFLVALDQQSLLQVALPQEPDVVGIYVMTGNLLLALSFAAIVWWWVRRHWRDLQRLAAAAERIGNGELHTRAEVSRFSDIRALVGNFNAMAARLELLVSQQRGLINGVAHELRTPIARLGFELDLLQSAGDDTLRRQRCDEMRDELTELDALITEMLSYARLQQAGAALVQDTVSGCDWVASVLGAVALEARMKGIALVEPPSCPPELQMEPRLLARAALNLLRNAIRHANGQVALSMGIPDGMQQLIVDDDGPGIAAADRERVFEPFARLDDSRTRDTGGVGLGLAIVRQVALAHGGSARVETSPLGGARFMLEWPCTGKRPA